MSIDHIHEITKIDKFFIHKLQNLVRFEESLKGGITPETYLQGKKYGYPDKVLAWLAGVEEASSPTASQLQDGGHLRRRVPGPDPYFYATYDDHCDARNFPRSGQKTVIVLGVRPHPHRPGHRV